jgi:hypothetical protein
MYINVLYTHLMPPSSKSSAYSAGILEQSMGARNRVGTELSYRPPAYVASLAESIPELLKL